MEKNILIEIEFSNNLIFIFSIGFDELFRLFIESDAEDQNLLNEKLKDLNKLIRSANNKRPIKFIDN